MIFNLQKNNTRNFLDINDFKSYVLTLASTTKYLDSPTLAVIIETLDFISKSFDLLQPKEKDITNLIINDYDLKLSLKKVYKRNASISKKKNNIILDDIEVLKQPPELFNNKQLEQFKKTLNEPINEVKISLEASLLEAVKKILASNEKPLKEVKITKKPSAKS